MNGIVQIVLTAIAVIGGGGGLLAWLRAPAEKRKITSEARSEESDAAKSLSEAAETLVRSFQVQVTDLSQKLDQANLQIANLKELLEHERNIAQRSIYTLTVQNDNLLGRIKDLESKAG